MVLGCLKLEFRVTFFEVLDFLKLKFHEKWNIAKYFSNSGKTLIILKNSGIWLFLPIYIYILKYVLKPRLENTVIEEPRATFICKNMALGLVLKPCLANMAIEVPRAAFISENVATDLV